MNGYQHFKTLQASLKSRHHADTPANSETVNARILSLAQLEAIGHIQDAILAINKLQNGMNQLTALHHLSLQSPLLDELGMLWHEIEGVLFEHNLAAARLRHHAKVPQPLPKPMAPQRTAIAA